MFMSSHSTLKVSQVIVCSENSLWRALFGIIWHLRIFPIWTKLCMQ